MISVTCLPKSQGSVLDPDKIRAIGVSSVIYSIWSSCRYRHLTTWMSRVAPPQLLGGVSGRSPDAHEIELSLSFQSLDPNQDVTAVFLDRCKCFDRVIPRFALAVARDVGLPEQVYRASLGFYTNQLKIFKVGNFFGRRVASVNSAIQGCSFSLVMINCLYSIMTRALSTQFSRISVASFIDDAKIWGPAEYVNEIADAFEWVVQFDHDIGQSLNPEKTHIVARKVIKAKKLKQKIGRPVQISQQVKSLGRVQQMSRMRCAKLQDKRAEDAIQVLKKIKQLPLNSQQKTMYVHAHAHAKWVYGAEMQGISKKVLQRMRSKICDIFDPSKHKLRSCFFLMATHRDPFLDPFAKWCFHTMKHLRKLAKRSPAVAAKALYQCKQCRPQSGASNGFANVLAFLFAELKWQIGDPTEGAIITEFGEFAITSFSDNFFSDILAASLRTYLVNQQSPRHESGDVPPNTQVDGVLTRFLLDSSCNRDETANFVLPFLPQLPRDFQYNRNLLTMALSGRIFTGPRLMAASLTTTDSCKGCGHRETHHHLFSECPQYAESRPENPPETPSLSWNTGIIFGPPLDVSNGSFAVPAREDLFTTDEIVFVDGSCFAHFWPQLRSAASAYYTEGVGAYACSLPGTDVSSQRAEIFALALVLKHSQGSIRMASDCQNVVDIFTALQGCQFDVSHFKKLDNWDLWELVVRQAQGRQGISIFKVRAHLNLSDRSQERHLTYGNSQADKAAKELAFQGFNHKFQELHHRISDAICLQCHIITTLAKRIQLGFEVPDESLPDDPSRDLMPSQAGACSCVPTTRIRGKTSVCLGRHGCHICQTERLGNLESEFVDSCSRNRVTPYLFSRIQTKYSKTSEILTLTIPFPTDLSGPTIQQLRAKTRGCSSEYAQALVDFSIGCKVSFSNHAWGPKVPWALMFLDFASRFPDLPEWQSNVNFHRNVCQFRVRIQRLTVLKGIEVKAFKQANSLCDFGLGRLSGFCGVFNPSSPLRVWYLLIKICLDICSGIPKSELRIDFADLHRSSVSIWFYYIDSHSLFVFPSSEISRGPSSVLQKKNEHNFYFPSFSWEDYFKFDIIWLAFMLFNLKPPTRRRQQGTGFVVWSCFHPSCRGGCEVQVTEKLLLK